MVVHPLSCLFEHDIPT